MYKYLVITNGSIKMYPSNILNPEEHLGNMGITYCEIYNHRGGKMKYAFIKPDRKIKICSCSGRNFLAKYEIILENFNSMLYSKDNLLKNLTEEELNLIYESPNDIDWEDLSRHYKLSEEFIETFQNKVNWIRISTNQKLSEKFIEKHVDKINQALSEKFIEKYEDKVDWKGISREQKLSEDFIRKFQNKIDLRDIYLNYMTIKP